MEEPLEETLVKKIRVDDRVRLISSGKLGTVTAIPNENMVSINYDDGKSTYAMNEILVEKINQDAPGGSVPINVNTLKASANIKRKFTNADDAWWAIHNALLEKKIIPFEWSRGGLGLIKGYIYDKQGTHFKAISKTIALGGRIDRTISKMVIDLSQYGLPTAIQKFTFFPTGFRHEIFPDPESILASMSSGGGGGGGGGGKTNLNHLAAKGGSMKRKHRNRRFTKRKHKKSKKSHKMRG